jgi:hypothetical protein
MAFLGFQELEKAIFEELAQAILELLNHALTLKRVQGEQVLKLLKKY